MNAEDKRAQRLQLLEDDIGRSLRESERSGELKAAPSYGKPLAFGDGYDETPDELRMAMKVLKDAGVLPPEVELMREAAALQEKINTCAGAATLRQLQQQLLQLRQLISLRLERLRRSSAL